MQTRKYIAHVKENGDQQFLEDHLFEVASLSQKFSAKINCSSAGEIIGLLHDFGKYSDEFQTYLKSATGVINPDEDDYVTAKHLKGKIDHSTAGAQYIWNSLKNIGSVGQGELCGQILGLCIASHHSGLINCINLDGAQIFNARMLKDDLKTHLLQCQNEANDQIKQKAQKLTNQELVRDFFCTICKIVNIDNLKNGFLSKIDYFNLGFLVKFLFSCLIDADRLSSAEFEDPNRKIERLNNANPIEWSVAVNRLEIFLEQLSVHNHVDELRQKISQSCKDKADLPQGLYTLTVPTGGGKTYASLRYALHHAKKYILDRIIYVIPYTSIIEQNADAIRKVIETHNDAGKWVLELHSNIEPEQQTWHSKLVAENLDAPIVLTTMVQLLEIMFSGGTRGIRKLHQLANSVIIFDEIQTLPIKCVHLFCNAINFLVKNCKTTVVLCTATQPLLNELNYSDKGQLHIPKENELASDVTGLFTQLNRVDIHNKIKSGGWNLQEVTDLALKEFNFCCNCLIIVNTKEWARSLYQNCEQYISDRNALFHLSTNQYPAHRKKILDKMRTRLANGLPVLCISTQLIEAGVDIDFAVVIRFLAGLDSIAQAAGRCNRNGRLADSNENLINGRVYIVNPDQEKIEILIDIMEGKRQTQRVLSESHANLLSPEAIKRYFQYYFFERAKEMSYPLGVKEIGKVDTMYNLLTDNPLSIKCYRPNKVPLLLQSFMVAGQQFKSIDAPTKSIVIQHGDGYQIVNELCAVAKAFNAKHYTELLKKAQKYSINVFPNIWKRLQEKNAIVETQVGEGIYYLKEEYYSETFGVNEEPVNSQSILVM